MASSSNPHATTFGATIIPSPQKSDAELTLPPAIADSPNITPAASHEDLNYSDRRPPPTSPFYQHPPASFEKVHTRSSSKPNILINEKDVEAGLRTPLATDSDNPFAGKASVDYNKECRMWPSRQTLVQSRKNEKRKRREKKFLGGCGPVRDFWARFSKEQKLWIKVASGLFFLGVVVAIAVGITIAVNGTVYVSDGHNEQIPDPSDPDSSSGSKRWLS